MTEVANKASDRTAKAAAAIQTHPGHDSGVIEELYGEAGHWSVNLGEEKIHAKRISGKYRKIKWLAASIYLFYFLGPYLRWEGRQAILFDIPGRKYHVFGITFWPQDVWTLSLVLITFFLALFAATAVAGRVFCGYICWQTVWVDVYTWIEEKIEGPPAARRALDKAPWTTRKIAIKSAKTSIFLALSALTGITFTAYFIDVYDLWGRYLALQGPVYIWSVPLVFLAGSYIGVAIMREQICFWLCPYARIQGVMADMDSIVPTYDYRRGEPRGRLKKGAPAEDQGDCVACNLCVAVCPVGVDIRHGQQEGCVMCALCADACDSVMEKVKKPKGLIRYMSLNELTTGKASNTFLRGRVVVYAVILTLAMGGIVHGVASRHTIKLTVIHERQPLYVRLSDGSIQNSYTLKAINKSHADMRVRISVSGLDNAEARGLEGEKVIPADKVKTFRVFVKSGARDFGGGTAPLFFEAVNLDTPEMKVRYKSAFIGPERRG